MTIRCSNNLHLSQLQTQGCLKVRITDRRELAAARQRCRQLALRLGKGLCLSYRRPWLYAILTDCEPDHSSGLRLTEGFDLQHQRAIAS